MKSLFLSLFFFLFLFGTQAHNYEELFAFDEEKFKSEFTLSTSAEQFFDQDDNLTSFTETGLLPSAFEPLQDNPLAANDNYEILGMSPFVFSLGFTCLGGCVITPILSGPLAWLFVYIDSDHNKQATRKAFWGCFAGNAIGVLLYGVFLVVATAGGI